MRLFEIRHEPVIFIHGNGDAALHTQAPLATGWSRSIQYFLEQGYSPVNVINFLLSFIVKKIGSTILILFLETFFEW